VSRYERGPLLVCAAIVLVVLALIGSALLDALGELRLRQQLRDLRSPSAGVRLCAEQSSGFG